MPTSRGMHGPGTPRSIHPSTGAPTLGTMQAGMTLGITAAGMTLGTSEPAGVSAGMTLGTVEAGTIRGSTDGTTLGTTAAGMTRGTMDMHIFTTQDTEVRDGTAGTGSTLQGPWPTAHPSGAASVPFQGMQATGVPRPPGTGAD